MIMLQHSFTFSYLIQGFSSASAFIQIVVHMKFVCKPTKFKYRVSHHLMLNQFTSTSIVFSTRQSRAC